MLYFIVEESYHIIHKRKRVLFMYLLSEGFDSFSHNINEDMSYIIK